MHPVYLRVLAFAISVVCLICGVKFSQDGFSDIESFKQLERLAPSKLIGVIQGENQLKGLVSKTSASNFLKSPKTNTPSLYYRYLLEREERDSDGDTRWVTVTDETRSVDFILEDSTAKATVFTQNWTDNIRWFLPKRYSIKTGDFRYTEWRLEPEDRVSMFAWADVQPRTDVSPEISLRFDIQGHYLPVITTLTAADVRADIGNTAIIEIWAGVSLVALGLMCFVYATQIHRILAFLSLLTVFSMGILGVYGLASLSSDVRGGADYLQSQQDKAEVTVRQLLASESIDWSGWPQTNKENTQAYARLALWQQNRIAEIRSNLGVLQAIYRQQISRFPESVYAWLAGIDKPALRIQLTAPEQTIVKRNIEGFVPTKLDGFVYWWVIAGGIFFCIFTYLGFRYVKVKRMIENIPTSLTAGVSFGLAEVKGKVRLIEDNSLKGPLTKQSCVWYRYLIQEHRGSGKNARWVTIQDDEQHLRFQCEDREGLLTIDPTEADITTRHKKVKTKGSMRYSEWLLKPSDKLYALGSAKIDPMKHDQLVLGKADNATDNTDLFVLTNYSEKELMIKKASMSILALALAFSGMFASAVFYFGMNGQFSATDYLLSALLAPSFLIFFMLILHYNDIIFLQRRANRNWANIQVSLKKRADLLPQLQNVLAQYQLHEKNLLEQLTEQRKQVSNSTNSVQGAGQFIQKEHQLVNELKLAVEAYPDLKANELVLKFMSTLTALENEVALMRTGFNDAVTEYNMRIESFPDVVLARIFKFNRKEMIFAD